MVKTITSISDEQRAQMPGHVEKWIALRLKTGEADWATFARAAKQCYEYSNLAWHDTIIHTPSPMAGAIVSSMLSWESERGKKVNELVPVGHRILAYHLSGTLYAHVVPMNVTTWRKQGVQPRKIWEGERVGTSPQVSRTHVVLRAENANFTMPLEELRRRWYNYISGQWNAQWHAYTSFFRDVMKLELDGDLWDRDKAYSEANMAAGWWWPQQDCIVVSNRPSVLEVERFGEHGRRLHCEDGPAIAFPDGYELYFWHDTLVPEGLIKGTWTTREIFAEENAEVRRCAIEKMGWDEFIVQAGLSQVGEDVDDPGNPGMTLSLYDVPEQIFEAEVRVLLCVNATIERDGTRRRFGLTVPAEIDDPVEAAAWTFDCPVEVYRDLARAC